MSPLKKFKRTRTSWVEFKRKLIMQVKQHPSVWKKCYTEKQGAWRTIERKMGYPCPLKELQASWASLRAVYFRKIFIRTIERNFEAPNWTYFHDMTFLYDIVKENIQRKLGGISPPLFKPKQNSNESKYFRCPCCLHVKTFLSSARGISSVETEVKQQDGCGKITTTTSETCFGNNEEDIENSIDSESVHSICSLNAKRTENQSCFLTNSPEPQQNEIQNSLDRASPTKTFEVLELMDDIETSNESSQHQPASTKNMADNHSYEVLSQPLQESLFIRINTSVERMKLPSPELNELTSLFTINDYLEDSSSLTGSESHSMEQTQSNGPSEITNKEVSILSGQSDHSGAVFKLKDYSPLYMSAHQLRTIERSKIIAAVKANPATYLNYSKKKSTEHNLAWDRVTKEVGTVPLHTIKNRWRMLKIRYLKELVYERYSNGMDKSMWECFEQLEFLRPHMQKDINEIHNTRIQMQDTIRKRAEESSKVIKSIPRLKEPVKENETNEISNIKYISKITPDQPQFYKGDKGVVAYVNANQNIKIANVETVKPIIPLPKQIEEPVVLDENTLPILQNRPVKVTAVQVPQRLDLTNEYDEDVSINNEEVPPPAKKPRRSTGSEKNETNVHGNETFKRLPSPPAFDLTDDDNRDISKNNAGPEKNEKNVHAIETPKRLPSPPASSLTLNLTADKVTVQSLKVQPHKPQKVFPPLDLTLDDDHPVVVPKPTSKKNCTSKFQQAFVDELVNTNKVFPTFDLTTDEDKNQNKNASNENEIANTSEKDDANVICLEDDDSVGSYEEVIVYFADF